MNIIDHYLNTDIENFNKITIKQQGILHKSAKHSLVTQSLRLVLQNIKSKVGLQYNFLHLQPDSSYLN